MLCSIRQRYNLKANHNKIVEGSLIPKLCSIRQRYNLKANHNRLMMCFSQNQVVFNTSKIQFESKSQQDVATQFVQAVVFNTSKIQFESKSQLLDKYKENNLSCVQYVKDTI